MPEMITQVITQEELALALAYKPKVQMEMIDEEEEFIVCNTSTETLPIYESMEDVTPTKAELSPNPSTSSQENIYQVDTEVGKKVDEKTEKHVTKKKEEFMLPHWCVYIAWFLFAISCLVSAFFTILYSLEWGAEKSQEWLTAMLLSFFNSVVLIQPIKVSVKTVRSMQKHTGDYAKHVDVGIIAV